MCYALVEFQKLKILASLLVCCCSGLWSLIAVAVFVQRYDSQSLCNLHATFEGLCYCNLRLPYLVRDTYTYIFDSAH